VSFQILEIYPCLVLLRIQVAYYFYLCVVGSEGLFKINTIPAFRPVLSFFYLSK